MMPADNGLVTDSDLSRGDKIYHYAGNGCCTWFYFAKTIQDLAGETVHYSAKVKSGCVISPISAAEWQQQHSNRLAIRPRNSSLNAHKVLTELSIAPDSLINATWQQQLHLMLTLQAIEKA